MISANKGEWSELYVLFKLLGDKLVHAGDGELRRLEAFYPVIKIIREELDRHLEYSIRNDVVIVAEDHSEIARIDCSEFLAESQALFPKIQEGGRGDGAFEIPSVSAFLHKIHCRKVKARSQDKSDIHIVIHDHHTGQDPNLGFSIKSEAGASPSLLNASGATRFVFEICGNPMNDDVASETNSISSRGKTMDRAEALFRKGFHLRFHSIPNSTFRGNLCMIDSRLPEIVGWMLKDSYIARTLDISQAVDRMRSSNPLHYDLSEGHDYYGHKIKSMLTSIALGMLPAAPWDGRYDATGGYIVVKEDGDVVCFHLYDKNMLEDYLFNNTRFETPSTSRYDFGHVYEKEGKFFFDLVLQIRFK